MMLRPRTPNLEMPSVHLLLFARDLLFFVKARAHSEIGGVCSCEMKRDRGSENWILSPQTTVLHVFQLVGLALIPCNMK
jgi:hypothetical protein